MRNAVEALGIPDWEAKQSKIVRTLDMTLLPQLWILYMFNYLNRTNIAYGPYSSIDLRKTDFDK